MNIPHVLYCRSIREARYEAVKFIMEHGKYRRDQRGERTKYVRNLLICIPGEKCELSSDPLQARLGIDFKMGLTDDETAEERGNSFEYAYGWELREDNALEKTIKLLRNDPETRRACIPIFKPRHVGKEEIPCFCTLVFDVEDDVLNETAFGRSNENVIAMQNDAYGFGGGLLPWMAEQLGYGVGDYVQHIVNAHVRLDSEGDLIKEILSEGAVV